MSWLGKVQTAQSIYALKLRATIFGYIRPLVVYGNIKPLLEEAYLLHSRAYLSSPWISFILAIDFLRSVLFVRYLAFGIVVT